MKRFSALIQFNFFLLMILSSNLTARNGMVLNDDVFFNNRGIEALKSGNNIAAEKLFKKAIVINSKVKFYFNNLAAALIRQKKYKEAYSYLEKAIEIDSEYARALSNMAVTCFHLGEYLDSYRFYLRSKEADEGYTVKRFDKAEVKKRIRQEKIKDPDNKTYDEILKKLED